MAWLSILGLYNYKDDIFRNMVIPNGVDRETLINTILYDNGELGLLYADYDVLVDLIGTWSQSELDIWTRLYNAFNAEYNPLWNVDENTTETREIEREDTGTSNASSTVKGEVIGYNSNDFNDEDRDTSSATENTTGTSNVTETFTRQRGGNIGVTMSQQLLEAELEVRPKLNIYKYISNSFKERFCIMIY